MSRHRQPDGLRPASKWRKDLPFWVLIGILGVLGAAVLLLLGAVLTIILVAVIG
jgi:hypothetical protein